MSAMTGRRRRVLALVCFAAVVLAGCESADSGAAPTSSAPETSSATETTGSGCAGVSSEGQALGAVLIQFLDGSATADQVRTAADRLGDELAAARENAEANTSAALDDAQAALDQLLTALQAQPVDRAGVRTASTDLLAALGDLAKVCQPAPTS
jgi:hypothetical protein